jgi:biofilm PGA synthesis protein PgaA
MGIVSAVCARQTVQSGQAPSKADADQAMTSVQADVRKGDLASALDTLQPFVRYPERFPTLYSDYLVILVWAGHYPEALERFQSLPDNVPRRAYLLRNMAKAYFDTQAYEKAERLYMQTLERMPDDETALQGLVDTLAASGRFDQAVAALDRYTEPEARVSQALLKARLLMAQERYGQALIWYDTLIQIRPGDAETIARHRDDLIAGLPRDKQDELIRQMKIQAGRGDPGAVEDYILCLSLSRRFREAVDEMTAFHVNPDKSSEYKVYWFGWAMFKAERYADAQGLFSAISRRNEAYLAPRIGLIYCTAAMADFDAAAKTLGELSRKHPTHIEVLFARAFVYEQQNRFWDTIRVYDLILELYPGNQAAMRARLRAFSDLGASSLAADMAESELPDDIALHQSIRDDQGVDRMEWDESNQAAAMLQRLRAESRDIQHTFDYLAALAKAERNREIVVEYEKLPPDDDTEKKIPAWVKTIAADAYASLGQRKRALALFDQALGQEPGSRDARLGKFYVLQDLREWKAAEAILASLESAAPRKITRNGRETTHPDYFELAMARGWFLAEQNRLGEAEDHFRALQEQVPANIEVRDALGHVYLWRGWPRRAYKEFRIIDTLQPDYSPSQPGKLDTMNTLGLKAEARELTARKMEKRPNDRHLQNVQRAFAVEQMNVSRTELAGTLEDDDTLDLSIRQTFSTPMSLKSRLYVYVLWRRTWHDTEDDDEAVYCQRIGVGMEHLFNDAWKIDTSLSTGYDDVEDVGAAARLTYTPLDSLSFSLFGDSFSTDVPGRARLSDIEANKIGAEGTWRQSEWREAWIGFTHSYFSDDNERSEAYAGYEQNLWAWHDWRMRAMLELHGEWNSMGDTTDYFNPKQAWSASVTHMTEQTVLKYDQRAFLHRLYLTLGSQQQKGFSNAWIGSLRYEQEHEFSDRHHLLMGIGTGRSVYDGEAVQDVNADLVYQWRFK